MDESEIEAKVQASAENAERAEHLARELTVNIDGTLYLDLHKFVRVLTMNIEIFEGQHALIHLLAGDVNSPCREDDVFAGERKVLSQLSQIATAASTL